MGSNREDGCGLCVAIIAMVGGAIICGSLGFSLWHILEVVGRCVNF